MPLSESFENSTPFSQKSRRRKEGYDLGTCQGLSILSAWGCLWICLLAGISITPSNRSFEGHSRVGFIVSCVPFANWLISIFPEWAKVQVGSVRRTGGRRLKTENKLWKIQKIRKKLKPKFLRTPTIFSKTKNCNKTKNRHFLALYSSSSIPSLKNHKKMFKFMVSKRLDFLKNLNRFFLFSCFSKNDIRTPLG